MSKSFFKFASIILAVSLMCSFACILISCNNDVYTVPPENCIVAVDGILTLKPINNENDCVFIENDIKGIAKDMYLNYYSVVKGKEINITISEENDYGTRIYPNAGCGRILTAIKIDNETVPYDYYLRQNVTRTFSKYTEITACYEEYTNVGLLFVDKNNLSKNDIYAYDWFDGQNVNGDCRYIYLNGNFEDGKDNWNTNLTVSDYDFIDCRLNTTLTYEFSSGEIREIQVTAITVENFDYTDFYFCVIGCMARDNGQNKYFVERINEVNINSIASLTQEIEKNENLLNVRFK